MRDHDAPAVAQALRGFSGKVDRLSAMTFYLPGFHAGIDETHVARSHPERAGETINSSRVFHAITPETATTCHYFFASGNDGQTDHEDAQGFPPAG